MLRKSPARLEDMLARMEGDPVDSTNWWEEILTLARLSASDGRGLSRQKLDVIDLVTEIVEDACFEGAAQRVRVIYQGADSFIADVNGELIYRAIENVIRNAVKFSSLGGSVVVSSSIDGDRLKLDICDNGPGVREDELDSIFASLHGRPTICPSQAMRVSGWLLLVRRWSGTAAS